MGEAFSLFCQVVSVSVVSLVVLYKLLEWALSRVTVGDYGNKYVLITGCDTGFGNLLAKRLDSLGFHVFAACLTSEGAEQLQAACSDRVVTLILDVTDDASIKRAREFVEERLPHGKGLWGLVNNAGVGGVPLALEWLSRDDWTKMLAINLMGVIFTTQAFLPLVREAKGRVVNIASQMGRIAATNAPYCVAKFGVEAFSDCLRRETYHQGLKVCILEPGYFNTAIIKPDQLISNFKRQYEATPPEVRQHYKWLTLDSFPKLIEKVLSKRSNDLHLVIDGYVLALTSRFPPTRQVIGYDARFKFRPLWNLPTPLADWYLARK